MFFSFPLEDLLYNLLEQLHANVHVSVKEYLKFEPLIIYVNSQ